MKTGRRRTYQNLVLMALILGLGWYNWWSSQVEESTLHWFPLDPKNVTRLVIEVNGGKRTVLALEQQDWWMLQPVRRAADQGRVAHLLQLPSRSPLSSYPLDESRLDEFGLSPPGVNLQLNDQLVQFGGLEPLGGNRYLRHDRRLHLMADDYQPLLLAGWSQLLNRRLLDPGQVPVQVLTPFASLQLEGEGWVDGEGIAVPGAAALVAAWQQEQAVDIVPVTDPVDVLGVARLVLADGNTLSFEVAELDQNPTLHPVGADYLLLIEADQLDALLRLEQETPAQPGSG